MMQSDYRAVVIDLLPPFNSCLPLRLALPLNTLIPSKVIYSIIVQGISVIPLIIFAAQAGNNSARAKIGNNYRSLVFFTAQHSKLVWESASDAPRLAIIIWYGYCDKK